MLGARAALSLRDPCRHRLGRRHEALEHIGELFAIEREIQGRGPDERLAVRQARSVPILEALRRLLDDALARGSVKSTLADAIRYSTTRWEALTRYTTDGRLEMSNNAAERAIRPLALGRKNWTFAGSDAAGKGPPPCTPSSRPPR